VTGAPNYKNVYAVDDFSVAARDSIVLSVEEADSLINLIDDLDLENRLLYIDLKEQQSVSRIDSLTQAQYIRVLEEQQQSWLHRALSYPALWFILGAYVGLQVSQAQ
jgi:hypothetical protein